MKYEKIVKAKFIERENRFVARVGIGEGDDAETVKVEIEEYVFTKEILKNLFEVLKNIRTTITRASLLGIPRVISLEIVVLL